MMNKISKNGFTLIELLVAMSIISLIAMAFFTIVNTSIKSNTKNEKDIKSLNVVTSEIESIREQLKDTSTEDIILYGDLSIEKWDSNGKVTLVKDSKGNNHTVSNNKIKYTKEVDGFDCDLELNISRNNISSSNMYIYNIEISSQLKNKYFSKKKIILDTKIFGR